MAGRYFSLSPVINNRTETANGKALEVGIAVRKTECQGRTIAAVSHANIPHLPMVKASLETRLAPASQVHRPHRKKARHALAEFVNVACAERRKSA